MSVEYLHIYGEITEVYVNNMIDIVNASAFREYSRIIISESQDCIYKRIDILGGEKYNKFFKVDIPVNAVLDIKKNIVDFLNQKNLAFVFVCTCYYSDREPEYSVFSQVSEHKISLEQILEDARKDMYQILCQKTNTINLRA